VNVTPLTLPSSSAVRQALRARGWDEGPAADAAGGIAPLALQLSDISTDVLEALVPFAGRLGLDVVTGDGWAILSGSRARLGALARPWTVPPALAELAMQVGLGLPADPPLAWRIARGTIPLDGPVLMGIVNVTPDSFSDGGRAQDTEAACRLAAQLVAEGATILDVGGESTRPGRDTGVPADEEMRRVLPVIERLVREHPAVPVSIDTVKSSVARAALDAGAAIVNDVTAFRLDPDGARVAAEFGAGVALMHSRGGLLEIASYTHARYPDGVAAEVSRELAERVASTTEAGVAPEAIALDPGFGFSKTTAQNLELLQHLDVLTALGRPLLVGPSRKRFLGQATGREVAAERDVATATACALAYERGARLFRVHDVGSARDALRTAAAVAAQPTA
jgi:dihydropteroate synthase